MRECRDMWLQKHLGLTSSNCASEILTALPSSSSSSLQQPKGSSKSPASHNMLYQRGDFHNLSVRL